MSACQKSGVGPITNYHVGASALCNVAHYHKIASVTAPLCEVVRDGRRKLDPLNSKRINRLVAAYQHTVGLKDRSGPNDRQDRR